MKTLSRAQILILSAMLVGYTAALLWVNCAWIPYPAENDLPYVGWLVQNLSLSRPESLANVVYPPGLPVVLKLVQPLFGSLLRAALAWQVLVISVGLLLLFRTALAIFSTWTPALLTLICGMAASTTVATSEFADGTCTALLLGGLCILAIRQADGYGFFFLGLFSALAYLFRVHYLVLAALVPLAILLAGYGLRTAFRQSLSFLSGFAAGAWPLWLLNLLAYGDPFHAGASQYNIADYAVPSAIDWDDFLATYNRWPLSRILKEQPGYFIRHVLEVAGDVFGAKLSVAAAVSGVAVLLDENQKRRRLLTFIGIFAVLYAGAVIVPTRLTERAYLPIAMLASLLVGGALARLRAHLPQPHGGAIALCAALMVGFPTQLREQLHTKKGNLWRNQQIVDALLRHGMSKGEEVFCNDWNIFNLADPNFDTFYNYGGWILLDSRYLALRPPPRASTLQEWQDFFAAHHIRFAILQRRPDTEEIFTRTPASWERIFQNNQVTVFSLPVHG